MTFVFQLPGYSDLAQRMLGERIGKRRGECTRCRGTGVDETVDYKRVEDDACPRCDGLGYLTDEDTGEEDRRCTACDVTRRVTAQERWMRGRRVPPCACGGSLELVRAIPREQSAREVDAEINNAYQRWMQTHG